MRIEREDNRRAANLAGAVLQSLGEPRVAEVYAVEVPDRYGPTG
jgi:hypothetical protein